MGKIVSSEYNGTDDMNNQNDKKDDGWTPRPGYLAKRKFVATPSGWFPVDDGFGAREFLIDICIVCVSVVYVTFDTRIMRSCVDIRSLLRQNNYSSKLHQKWRLTSFSICALVLFYFKTTLYCSWKASDWWTMVSGGFRR